MISISEYRLPARYDPSDQIHDDEIRPQCMLGGRGGCRATSHRGCDGMYLIAMPFRAVCRALTCVSLSMSFLCLSFLLLPPFPFPFPCPPPPPPPRSSSSCFFLCHPLLLLVLSHLPHRLSGTCDTGPTVPACLHACMSRTTGPDQNQNHPSPLLAFSLGPVLW